jgi:Flp pilus assembly protein TadG
MTSKFRGLSSKALAFLRAKRGNVAMMFALTLVPMTIAAGAGLDMARAMMVKANMEDALDAAALAVGAQSTKPTSCAATATDSACVALQQLAQKYFTANYKADSTYGSPGSVSMTIANESVVLTVTDSLPTTLLSAVGFSTVPVTASNTVVWGQTKLWVSLVLDNTGSMCEPDSNPCPGDTNSNIKINALKTATHQLLSTLQGVSAQPGDVQVSIVPFAKDVKMGTSYVNDSSISWTDWESQPPTSIDAVPGSSSGPGSSCPLNTGCVASPGSTTSTSTVPSSGMICPNYVSSSSVGLAGHYYNGCFNSTATQTKTTTATASTPITTKQTCTQVGSGTVSCVNKSGYPKTGSTTNNSSSTTTNGYTGDSGPTTTNSSSSTTSDGSSSCSGSGNSRTCTWTRTITETDVATTVTATGTNFTHSWVANSHSFWTGCVMDRGSSTAPGTSAGNDETDTGPSTGDSTTLFPAENSQSCPGAVVTALTYDWNNLSTQVDAMVAGGGTNQTVGLAHGMQTLTQGAPYSPPTLPPNTTRYIILLSDGLNTMDRWYGNGSAQSTSVDTRMAAACVNAKAQGIVIYTIFVDLNGTQGNSSVLQNCASDSSKYFDLTTSGAIITTFNSIAQQIASLHLSR